VDSVTLWLLSEAVLASIVSGNIQESDCGSNVFAKFSIVALLRGFPLIKFKAFF